MPALTEFLRSIKLPVMPEAATALVRSLQDERTDVTTVRDIIAKDPALSATVLRMANSAVFGLSRSVHTLDAAVQVVGMSHIRARALAICLTESFKLPPNLNRMAYWRHCMISAGYARWLAQQARQDEAQAWLAGMLHRLGELVMALKSPQLIDSVEIPPCAPGERWQRERSSLGFDEGQLIAEVALRWDFPDELVQAFRHESAPLRAEAFSPLAAIIHLASLLAEYPPETPEVVLQLPYVLLQALGLDPDALQAQLPDAESFVDSSLISA
ncbi:MAG: HDOD domain-containing protein [Rhodoferax sp.]